MKKAIAAIMLCVALTLCMSLSAFAEGSAQVGTSYWDAADFTIYSAYTYDSYGGLRPHYDARIHYSTNDVNGMYIYIGETTESSRPYCGFKLCLNVDQAENTRVDGGHYFVLTFSFEESCPNGNYNNQTGDPYIKINVSNNTGTSSSVTAVPEYVAGSGRWTSTAIVPVGSGNPLQVQQISFDSNIYSPRLGQDPYSIFFKCQSTVNLTEAQKIAEEQKEAIKDAADQITGAIDDSTTDITNAIGDAATDITNAIDDATDELTHGWDSPDGDPAGDVDDLTGNMGDAEDAALGGKSDEEIQAELTGLISSDSFPGPTSSGMVSSLFDDMLKAFGNEYQAVLMLSLVLGLAAFLVGRQYRAKGD